MIIFDFDQTLADSSVLTSFADFQNADLIAGLKPTAFAAQAREMLKTEDGCIVTARHSAQAEAIADWTLENLGVRLNVITLADMKMKEMGKRGQQINARIETKKAAVISKLSNVTRVFDNKEKNVARIRKLGIDAILM